MYVWAHLTSWSQNGDYDTEYSPRHVVFSSFNNAWTLCISVVLIPGARYGPALHDTSCFNVRCRRYPQFQYTNLSVDWAQLQPTGFLGGFTDFYPTLFHWKNRCVRTHVMRGDVRHFRWYPIPLKIKKVIAVWVHKPFTDLDVGIRFQIEWQPFQRRFQKYRKHSWFQPPIKNKTHACQNFSAWGVLYLRKGSDIPLSHSGRCSPQKLTLTTEQHKSCIHPTHKTFEARHFIWFCPFLDLFHRVLPQYVHSAYQQGPHDNNNWVNQAL